MLESEFGREKSRRSIRHEDGKTKAKTKAMHDFCERDFAVTSSVREFWCVVSITGWTLFMAVALLKRTPQSLSGKTYLGLTIIYFIDGMSLHNGGDRYLSLLAFHCLFLVPFTLETRCVAIPLAIWATGSPVNVFIIAFLFAPLLVRLRLLPSNFLVALNAGRKWSMIFFLLGIPLAKYCEANGICHLLDTGIPLLDEFLTPHNVFDHMTCFSEWQITLFLDLLVQLQRKNQIISPLVVGRPLFSATTTKDGYMK